MSSHWLNLLRAIPLYPGIAKRNLTVAFYVGAMRSNLNVARISREQGRKELRDFIVRLVHETPTDEIARLMRCGEIGQPVVTFEEAGHGISAVNTIESPTGRVTLMVEPEFGGHDQLTVDALANALMKEVGASIIEGRFSYRGGCYQPFNEKEKKFIEDNR